MNWGESWRTFKGQKLPVPSNWDMVQSCISNAEEAAQRALRLREQIDRCQPGDPRLREFSLELTMAKSDQRHWREYAEYYRKLSAKDKPHWSERVPGEDDQ